MSLGREVFETRRCRNSYGVIVRERYDKMKHKNMPVVTDSHDNVQWVEHVVE